MTDLRPQNEEGYYRIIVVDEEDNEIGYEFMFDAIEKGCIRRASRIFVFNEEGKLLIQQRSESVHKPLLLDQSAAGHVDEGETYDTAAKRELEEELGLTNCTLTTVVRSFKTPDFFNTIYKVVIPNDAAINFDPKEIAEIFWYSPEEIDDMIEKNSEQFTKQFLAVWKELREEIINS